MRLGGSLLLIAIGAVLRFAIETQSTHSVNVWAIGDILMIVGVIGLVLTAIFMMMKRRTEVIHRTPEGTSGTTWVTQNPSANVPY